MKPERIAEIKASLEEMSNQWDVPGALYQQHVEELLAEVESWQKEIDFVHSMGFGCDCAEFNTHPPHDHGCQWQAYLEGGKPWLDAKEGS